MSSVPEINMPTAAIKSVLSGLLGRKIASMKRVGSGRNSRVYRLTCEDATVYTAKSYFQNSPDRDRLGVEFSGLQFLWKNEVRCVPRPIIADKTHGYAVYEYIDGRTIPSLKVTDSDIDYSIDFLARLKQLKSSEGSHALPAASEACFSVRGIVDNISQRLSRLQALRKDGQQYHALDEFLTGDFVPSFNEITGWCQSNLNQSGISFTAELPGEERTLSPSDFGFHNALRCADGRIVFLDFEYFGWDDPAKMIADFLLHPAMRLGESLKRHFAAGILKRFADYKFIDKRVEIVYPLFGLKWCLIFLNEFVPELLLRRTFASKKELDNDKLMAAQLAKARRMLHRVMNEYEHFPYRT